MNRTVLRRAFGMLGPTVAAVTMLAFVVSLLGAGWGRGQPWPDGAALAAASGATFMTIVIAQTANAFACRSSTRWPGELGWTTNRLLLIPAAIELVFALVVLLVPLFADRLDQANPPLWGWVVAVASMPLVLMVDALEKHHRPRQEPSPLTFATVARVVELADTGGLNPPSRKGVWVRTPPRALGRE